MSEGVAGETFATEAYVDSELSHKISSITSGDGAIEISGTTVVPTVALKFDQTESKGNVSFAITPEGLKASVDVTTFEAIVVNSLPAVGEGSIYYLTQTAKENVYEK